MKAATKTAYSYTRFSTKAQARGVSKERQDTGAERWATENGYRLDTALNLFDLGVSAYRGKNAAQGKLGAFLRLVDEGTIPRGSALVVESLDRISRQEVPEALELFLGLLRKGITLVTLIPNPEVFERATLDTTKLIVAIVILGRANEESATKSNRGKHRWEKRRETMRAGKTVGNLCPRWLKSNEARTKFVIIPEKVKTVKRMFELALSGMGTHAIARSLNESGHKPLQHGREWSSGQVYHILTNRQVIGEKQPMIRVEGKSVPSGDVIVDFFPAVIKRDDFTKVQARFAKSRVGKLGPRQKHVSNLFTNLIWSFVGEQTRPWLFHLSGTHPTIACERVKPVGRKNKIHLPYQAFEQAVLSQLAEINVGDLTSGGKDTADKLDTINARLTEMRENLTEVRAGLKRKYSETLAGVAQTLEAEIADCEARQEELIDEQKSTLTESFVDLQSLVRRLQSATGETLKQLRTTVKARIAQTVKHIVITDIDEHSEQNRTVSLSIDFHNYDRSRLVVVNFRRSPANKGIDTTVESAVIDYSHIAKFAKQHGLDYAAYGSIGELARA